MLLINFIVPNLPILFILPYTRIKNVINRLKNILVLLKNVI